MDDRDVPAPLLEEARRLAAAGKDEAAKQAYLDILRRDPTHLAALNGLGVLAHASGHLSAARTLCEQAVRAHPDNAGARINLGNLLFEMADRAAARTHYEAALALDGDLAEAHRGLGRILCDGGEAEAGARHWQKSFPGQATEIQRYRGAGPGIAVLMLVSAKGGNIAVWRLFDDRLFAVTALYAEFYNPALALPPHALLFNAIGDADLCREALVRAEEIAARSKAPIVNAPAMVRLTGRAANARRLGGLPGVVTPKIRSLPRRAIAAEKDLPFPLLLRAPGFHTGEHFLRVERRGELETAIAALPGEELLAMDCLDARGADGLSRKYRVMMIGGALYPLHLAIGQNWKVHYFSAAMAGNEAHREEERRFLEDMPAILGAKAMTALSRIADALGLDYAGADFALDSSGALLLFEANATMVINPPGLDPIWDYRRAPIQRARNAAEKMLLAKSRA